MSSINQVQTLISTANELGFKAKSDPALAEKPMKDPTATVAEVAKTPFPEGLTINGRRGDDGTVMFAADAQTDLAKRLLSYATVFHTANMLITAARRNPELAEKIAKDPNKIVADMARYPMPEGVVFEVTKDAEGNFDLALTSDPNFEGEIDELILQNAG
jgi:hypothetical protein